MNKIHDNLIDSLNRINFIFKNQVIYIECLKDQNSFSIFGESFGPFEKGKKYRLKIFLAIPFIENNIMKIASSDHVDHVDVQRYAIAERDNQRLVQPDSDYFLNKIKEFQFFTQEEVKAGIKPKFDLDRFHSYLSNIIDGRLLKLLRLSRSKLSLDDEKRLTSSEKILFNYIHEHIRTWRNFFLEANQ